MESDDSTERNLDKSLKQQRQAEIFEAIKKLDSKNEQVKRKKTIDKTDDHMLMSSVEMKLPTSQAPTLKKANKSEWEKDGPAKNAYGLQKKKTLRGSRPTSSTNANMKN